MLHFCRDQVYWECNTGAASEVSPELSVKNTLKLEALPTQSDTAIDLAKRWGSMVYFYSRGHLTFAKDRLVAFSGMARAMQHILKDRYVGGLWEKDFIFHLTWHTVSWNTATTNRHKEYVAPSWSWASMDCTTAYLSWWKSKKDEGQGIRELTTVSIIHLEQVGADPFGQITSGHVCLTGPLVEVRLNNKRDIYYDGHKLAAWSEPDVWPREDGDEDGMNLIFLGLYSVAAPLSLEEYFGAAGILLQKVPGTAATFLRAGFCQIIDYNKLPSLYYEISVRDGGPFRNSSNFMFRLVRPTRIGSLPDEFFDPTRGYAIKII